MIDNAKILSEFLYKLKFSDIPEKTIENVRIFMIDYFAAAMAGYRINTNFNGAIEKYVFSQGERRIAVRFSRIRKSRFQKRHFWTRAMHTVQIWTMGTARLWDTSVRTYLRV